MPTLGWCGVPLWRAILGGGPSSGAGPRLRDASSTSREILIFKLEVCGGGGGAAKRSLGILIFRPGLVDNFSFGIVILKVPSCCCCCGCCCCCCSTTGGGTGLSFRFSLSFLCFFRSSLDLSRSLCLCLSFFFFSFLCLCSDTSSAVGGGSTTGVGGRTGAGAGSAIGSRFTSGDLRSVATVIGAGLAKLSLSRFDTKVGSVSMPLTGLAGASSFRSGPLVLIALPF